MSLSHLDEALNGIPIGLLTFNQGCQVLLANRFLATTLELPLGILTHAPSVFELLQASALLPKTALQDIHKICVAAAELSVGHKSTLTVASGEASRFLDFEVRELGNGHWMALFQDVTTSHITSERALELATRDPLTGLSNRQFFTAQMTAALSEGDRRAASQFDEADEDARHAIIMVDLDRFKAVNDTLGHPVGDQLLRLVAKRLRSLVRRDDVVARLGGDEFALIVSPAIEQDKLVRLARRIVDVLGNPYLVDGHQVNIGASVGVAVSPQDGCTEDRLLRSADLALYASKRNGRSTYSFFDPIMDERALARRSLEIDLRKAMSLREFELYFQPQINVDSRSVTGFEALLRWKSPSRGLVSPAAFLPLAEEMGLIVALDEWVLKEACIEAARWPDGISVAVKVSPRQFNDITTLVEVVAASLAASGLPGNRLEIEVTESILLENANEVLTALRRIRDMGARISMDDFGTGYSSLSQLHSFQFDKITIDRSFIIDGDDAPGQNAIARAITRLGTSLGSSTIAEGVETSDQLERVRAESCKSVQGYLLSRPVPAGQIDGLLNEFANSLSTSQVVQ